MWLNLATYSGLFSHFTVAEYMDDIIVAYLATLFISVYDPVKVKTTTIGRQTAEKPMAKSRTSNCAFSRNVIALPRWRHCVSVHGGVLSSTTFPEEAISCECPPRHDIIYSGKEFANHQSILIKSTNDLMSVD